MLNENDLIRLSYLMKIPVQRFHCTHLPLIPFRGQVKQPARVEVPGPSGRVTATMLKVRIVSTHALEVSIYILYVFSKMRESLLISSRGDQR